MKTPLQFANVEGAVSHQKEMAPRVVSQDDFEFNPQLICGLDAAYDGDKAYIVAVVWDIENRRFVEKVEAIDEVSVQYVPGLLGFREGPLLLRASGKLQSSPDVFMVDGQGVAHPRRFGLACHFGVEIDRPTIGVAKSFLYGRCMNETIVDPEGEMIGRIVSNGRGRKFYVSVGHKISLETASHLVERSLVEGHPFPLRKAHLEANRLKDRGSV